MSRDITSDKRKRYTRTLFGFNTAHLAWKVWLLQDYIKQTGNGTLEILPLYFELNTENYHRAVRVIEPFDADKLKSAMDRIEREVNAREDLWK